MDIVTKVTEKMNYFYLIAINMNHRACIDFKRRELPNTKLMGNM